MKEYPYKVFFWHKGEWLFSSAFQSREAADAQCEHLLTLYERARAIHTKLPVSEVLMRML